MRNGIIVLFSILIFTGFIENAYGSGKRIILPVPFNPQEDYYCGPSSLASVMQFYGRNISQHEIAKEVFKRDLGGSIALDLMLFARKMGFRGEIIEGDMEIIKSKIESGQPLIVLLDIGWFFYSRPHFAVVVGYDSEKNMIIVNSGRNREQEYEREEFIRIWKKMGNLILLVAPADSR